MPENPFLRRYRMECLHSMVNELPFDAFICQRSVHSNTEILILHFSKIVREMGPSQVREREKKDVFVFGVNRGTLYSSMMEHI